jgi:hypothetical protein
MAKATKNLKTVNILTDEENPIPVNIIAEEIVKISNAFTAIDKGKLSRRAIVLLIQDLTGLPQTSINRVLNAVPELKNVFVKKA